MPSADKAQKTMFKLMPVIMLVFFYTFPSGLVLYWTVQSLLGIAQTLYVIKTKDKVVLKKRDPKKGGFLQRLQAATAEYQKLKEQGLSDAEIKARMKKLAEEEKRKAEAKLAEARKRATDSDYERETRQREERERKRQEREERRLRRRGERLLRQFATVGDPNALLREDFDVKRLGHGQRRVREWLMAQQSAKEVTLRADGMITLLKQNTENLKYIRDDLKRLLTQA